MKNLIFIASILVLANAPLSAQDLLQRTQENQTKQFSEKQAKNPLAKLVENNRKVAKMTSTDVFKFSKNKSAKMKEAVSHSIELELDVSAVNLLLKEKQNQLTLKIPVSESRFFEIDLVQSNFKTSGYRVRTSQPQFAAYKNEDMLFYKGIVKNDYNSLAAVTISNNQIRVLVSDADGNYVVGKQPNTAAKYILYNDKNLKVKQQFECSTPPEPTAGSVDINNNGGTVINGKCVPVYLEADFEFYRQNGNSVSAVEVYLNSLFNEVETVYFNEDIGISISEIFVHTAPDPFINTANTAQALSLFRTLRQNNFNGRLAHLISGRSLGGGRASIDVLCSVNSNHAVSQLYSNFDPFPAYTWDLYVFSHEMGHNFGSYHTHNCSWNGNNTAIDGCSGSTEGNCPVPGIPSAGGTVMSYCHRQSVSINFSRGFGDQPGNFIRQRYNSGTCILECEEACNLIGNPCDDGNPLTANDVYDENCNCVGIFIDNNECTTLSNVALNKTTTQDGTQNNQLASYAVDGNTVGNWNAQTQTDYKLNAWWEVDLGQTYAIDEINVWNVQNENDVEMSNFVVFVSDNPFTSKDLGVTFNQQGVTAVSISGQAQLPSAINISNTGRYVRVQLNNKIGFIIVGEVEVMGCPITDCSTVGDPCDDDNPDTINDRINAQCICEGTKKSDCNLQGMPCDDGDPNTYNDVYDANCNCMGIPLIACNSSINVALNKNATQDGTQNNQLATYAVDGNTNGIWNALSQTNWENNAWWEVDLAQVSEIAEIKVWNIDGANAAVMANFYILVSENPFSSKDLDVSLNQPGVWSVLNNGQAGYPTNIPVNQNGRYVRVQLNGTGFVTMGELEVLGCPLQGASCNVIGNSCNDANENTINDAYDAACNCVGEVVNNACNLIVNRTANSGSGSLREAVDCAEDGATIYFSSSLVNQVIYLSANEIIVDKDLTILGPQGASVFINGTYAPRIFKVTANNSLTLSGISMIGGTVQNGSVILNEGTVTIDDAFILNCVTNPNPDKPRLSGSGDLFLSKNVSIQN